MNQSLPYPNNAEHQAMKQQVSILKSLVLLDVGSGLKPATFRFPDLPKWEVGALLIWPPCLDYRRLTTRWDDQMNWASISHLVNQYECTGLNPGPVKAMT